MGMVAGAQDRSCEHALVGLNRVGAWVSVPIGPGRQDRWGGPSSRARARIVDRVGWRIWNLHAFGTRWAAFRMHYCSEWVQLVCR